ncbi:MAG: DNA gyrase subunit A [Bacteroidetes bacterium]|nr:DNA gyrase subunit A [Bacteroidota bacterium]
MSENTAESNPRIVPVNIEDQMKSAYIDYSMSVIVSRAIPDVRDGFKPVHRRVLFGMYELGVTWNKPYKKSARIVGEVLGKYHPHGDSSVYNTMVRMAQHWSLRYPLVDGQGNYGSIDGDSPAAMRYTEARLQRISDEILSDLDKETVDFQLNFDDTLKEPTVMPTKIPNLLVNGSSGIAVGIATNIMPHNLTEVINGIVAYIDNREITIEELTKYIKAPDFPTGGIIYGMEGVRDAFLTGRGRVVLRGKAVIETLANGREQIIVTEIPYLVNKSQMIMKTYELMQEKKIEGISEVRDESDRDGMRVVYEIKKDAMASVVLNQLYNFTPLQTSFGVNNIALHNGRPKLLNLKDMISAFVEFRHEVTLRRIRYELAEAEKKAHILAGLLIALDHIDEVIQLIRSSNTPEIAREGLMSRFNLSEIQSKAILDMRLQRLTGLERDKIKAEYDELMKMINWYNEVLNDQVKQFMIIKEEMLDMQKRFGDERRSVIEYTAEEINMEDLIEDEEVIITISHLGYIKRTPLSEYRVQGRGGKGSIGGSTRDDDFIEQLFVATNHNYLLFFTQNGKCFWLKVYHVPEGNKTSKGRTIQNLIALESGDKVMAVVNVNNLSEEAFLNNNYLVFCTKKGIIKKTTLEEFSRPRQNGVNAMTIQDQDELIEVKLTNGNCEILMAVNSGRAVRFDESEVRPTGRTAQGVKGIFCDDQDEVVGMICIDKQDHTQSVMVVSEKGYGKRSDLEEYRITSRGKKGVKTINITDKTGNLIAIKQVTEEHDLMIINKSGITIRMEVKEISIKGRATQGVRLITLKEQDEIAAVTVVPHVEESQIEANQNNENPDDTASDETNQPIES